MNTDGNQITHGWILRKLMIIVSAFWVALSKVSNTLGIGYLEKVYGNALAHEMRKCGLRVAQQTKLEVFYDGVSVGYYVADLMIENCILLELKATAAIEDVHIAQTLNYLTTTKFPLCLILNFGTPRIVIKRVRL